MSHSTWRFNRGPLRGLYRDRENGWLFGVCAGIADRFGFRILTIRLIAAISLVLFFWPTAAAYLGASLIIREKPLIYSGNRSEQEFWRHGRDDWRHT